MDVKRKPLFNELGDVEVSKKRMINGNTTNLNDFNNMKYSWVSDWYRQAMNNFWIPEEINLFTDELKAELTEMIKTGVEHEIAWGHYVIGDNIQGINEKLIEDYIKYLGNLRLSAIGLEKVYENIEKNPAAWIDVLSDANSVKTDFFEGKSTAYAKAATLLDDL